MAASPVSAWKAQELFVKWLSLPDIQTALKNDLDLLERKSWTYADSALLGPSKKMWYLVLLCDFFFFLLLTAAHILLL